jgi:hypothetical protein
MSRSSQLFLQTTAGALAVGLIGAVFSWDLFVPGAIVGIIAALLTCGIRDPEPTMLDVLKQGQDTNIFKVCISDVMDRIPEVCILHKLHHSWFDPSLPSMHLSPWFALVFPSSEAKQPQQA